MNYREFSNCCVTFLHGMVNWPERAAHRLGMKPRVIYRWDNAEERGETVDIPADLAKKVRAMAESALTDPLTRDEWVMGYGLDQARAYIFHTTTPRFVARIVKITPRTSKNVLPVALEAEGEVDFESFFEGNPNHDFVLTEFFWLDLAAPKVVEELTRTAFDYAEDILSGQKAMDERDAVLRGKMV